MSSVRTRNQQRASVKPNIAREAEYGVLPVTRAERKLGFIDAFLILGGFSIATWSYTQGAFQASLVDFPDFLATVIAPNILMVGIFMLPIVFATKYGVDLWQWLKAIFGTRGIVPLLLLIVIVTLPWYAVNADIFASSISEALRVSVFQYNLPPEFHTPLAMLCVVIGSAMALGGPTLLKWVSRLLVPLLIIGGLAITVLAFSAVSFGELMAYEPDLSAYESPLVPYATSVEAAFAFALSWVATIAVVPRLTRRESDGYWASVAAYGFVAPFFVIVGGVLAIATVILGGTIDLGLASMVAAVGGPVATTMVLLFVIAANIGTQATAAYLWAVVLKTAFPRAPYPILIGAIAAYTLLVVGWGAILEYFGAFISLGAYLYGPLMGIVFVDFFFLRKKRLDLRSAYEVPGYANYRYHGGFNWLGFAALLGGFAASNLVFDAIAYAPRSPVFNFTTASLLGLVVGAGLYMLLTSIPALRRFMRKDLNNVSV